jgi:hypothetical protein
VAGEIPVSSAAGGEACHYSAEKKAALFFHLLLSTLLCRLAVCVGSMAKTA